MQINLEKYPTLLAWVIISVLTIHPKPSYAIGGQFGMEFAIDAPWRIEPATSSSNADKYGPIPIMIAFHDAVYELDRPAAASILAFPQTTVGKFVSVEVEEYADDQLAATHTYTHTHTRFHSGALREIERKRLVSTKQQEPTHEVCRPFLGQDCSALLEISDSHEWHAMFWYTPRVAVTPGRNIHLSITVTTELAGGLFKRAWRNALVVHAGEAPLPRFSNSWLYGDLHYHSQMTDNEGESAYSYRNVVRAMGAMGMDFLFATDHASNGNQVDGKTSSQYCPNPSAGDCYEARDLNQNRFAAAKNIIYGPDGANDAVARDVAINGIARFRSANILPQLFMAEEVDAWPEISGKEQQDGVVYYGDGLKYAWPNPNDCINKQGLDKCRSLYSQPYADQDQRSFLLRDEQGIRIEETIDDKLSGHSTVASIVKFFTPDGTKILPSRQHLLYLPTSASLSAEGWIASDTGPFGGAGKRLQDVLDEVQAGGFSFLAHPLTNSKPGGPGPDIIPYSDHELNRAWSSPAILGLQFWNENDHHYSTTDTRSPTVMFTGASDSNPRVTNFLYNWPWDNIGDFPWVWQHTGNVVSNELYQGAYTWDRYLRKGLKPSETQALSWLAKGEPRKWFMAGGSDAHGDLNFRRYGRPCVDRWCDVPVGDSALGKPRNLVLVAQAPAGTSAPAFPTAKRYTNTQLITALRTGTFSVTDGPAIRIAVDRNRNGAIDDADFQMGSTFNFYPGEHLPLLIEWKSTPEFGPVAQVDVYVGTPNATYAPKEHGPLPFNPNTNAYKKDPSGALQIKLVDAFEGDSVTGISAETRYHGLATVYLGPAQFGLTAADQQLFYLRAFAKTKQEHTAADQGQCSKVGTAGSSCGGRWAYANPVWGRYVFSCPGKTTKVLDSLAIHDIPLVSATIAPPILDGDNNGVADICEKDIPSPCPSGSTSPLGDIGSEVLVADPGQLPQIQPGKPIPATSCQTIKSLGFTPPANVIDTLPDTVIAFKPSVPNSESSTSETPPIAEFSMTPGNGTAPLTVALNASASKPGNTGGSITSYVWSSSDGQTAVGKTANLTFKDNGLMNIILTVTDEKGKTANEAHTLALLSDDDRIDRLLDWAEMAAPDAFDGHQDSQLILGYRARYYPNVNNYLGTKDGHVFAYGAPFGGLMDFGEWRMWEEKAGLK